MSVSRRRGRPGLIGTAARTAVIAGTAQATMGAVAGRQQQAAAQPSGGPADDLIAQLQQLAQLHAAGVLSPEEFAQAKAKLLS